MLIPANIQRKYSDLIPKINILKEKVNPILVNYCEKYNYAYSQRIKSVDSLTEKIETGRYNSIEEIDDIWGVSIIIPTLDMEDSVIEFINKSFEVIRVKKRGSTKKSPEVFRFDATRITCKYKNIIYERSIFNDIMFEIQVKSAYEHAWAVTTHSITYKTNNIDWRISRIVSQMKSTVEQLDILALSYDNFYKNITKSDWPELNAKEKFLSYLKEIQEKLPEEILPKDLSRFSENVINLIKQKEKNIYKLEKNIDEAVEIINEYTFQIGFDKIPKSITLFQFILCVLVERDFFNNSNIRNPVLISDEMEFFFPKLKNIEKRFAI
jgi:ppGpp synthetase/RelA/SpoT-type nucleotidyltranferase